MGRKTFGFAHVRPCQRFRISDGGEKLPPLPLRLVGDVVARLALVLAERPHLEAGLVAALGLQHGVGHRGRSRAAQLAESLGEGPQTVLHAGEGVVGSCREGREERKIK